MDKKKINKIVSYIMMENIQEADNMLNEYINAVVLDKSSLIQKNIADTITRLRNGNNN